MGYSRAELQYSLQWSCGQGRACGDCAAHESNRFGDAVAPLCKRPTDRSVCSTQRGQHAAVAAVAAYSGGSSGMIQQWQHTAVAAHNRGMIQHFRSNLSKKRCRGCLVACYMLHAARCTPHAPSEFFLHGARCVSYLASCMLDLHLVSYVVYVALGYTDCSRPIVPRRCALLVLIILPIALRAVAIAFSLSRAAVRCAGPRSRTLKCALERQRVLASFGLATAAVVASTMLPARFHGRCRAMQTCTACGSAKAPTAAMRCNPATAP